jgi:protein gp37
VADSSSIEWTQATQNPTTGCDKVSAGCDKVSAGCDNCYALTLAKRLKAMGAAKYQDDGDPRTSGPGFGLTPTPTRSGCRTPGGPRGWCSSTTPSVSAFGEAGRGTESLS